MNRQNMDLKVISLTILGLIMSPGAWADTCPTPPTSVEAGISSTVSFDSKTNQYIYSYTVQNLRSSLLSIDRFLVLVLVPSQPANAHSPYEWDMDFDTTPSRANWSTYMPDPKTPNLNKIPDPNNPGPEYLPSFYAIKPGAQLSGFSFQSPNPPAPAKYMIEGDTGIPSSTPTAVNDEPIPNCPGWDFTGPKYETMVTGITQGPADPNLLYVPIRLRGENAEHPPRPINPDHAAGKIGLLILSTASLDASKIDSTTLQFGPGLAKPLSSKLIPAHGDSDADEREDWERNALFSIANAKKNPKAQNLFALFDLKSVGTRCILDHALFLSGKTKDGKPIFGGVSIKTVGCDMKKPHARGAHNRSDDAKGDE